MMANPIIKIEYGLFHEYNYTLGVNPYPVVIDREMVMDRVRQSNGTRLSYLRAKKWKFSFNFRQMPLTMYNSLLAIREAPEPYTLILIDMTPTGTFSVHWESDMSNRYWSPLVTGGFSGEINLVEV